MKVSYPYLLAAITLSALSCKENKSQEEQSNEKSYQQIHEEAIVIDGHNDFLFFLVDENTAKVTNHEPLDFGDDLTGITHLDMNRQKEGGLDVQLFSVFCLGSQENPFDMAIRQLDTLEAIVSINADEMAMVTHSDEIEPLLKEGKSIAMAGVEGGHMIEDDLDKLDLLYDRGARYMTLTWNNSTSWASSSYDEQKNETRKGLTDFGRQVVKRMNQLGMIVDISHVGEQTFWDVMEVTAKPVIASHSSVYSLCNAHRNLKDDQLKAIAENDGVAMINFYPGYIDSVFWEEEIRFFERHQDETDSLMEVYDDEWIVEYYLYRKYADEAFEIRPTLEKLVDHIDYAIQLIGIDHVGIGSDFDGITISPRQMNDVTDFPLITRALLERGYSEQDVKKVLGANFLRVLLANEQ